MLAIIATNPMLRTVGRHFINAHTDGQDIALRPCCESVEYRSKIEWDDEVIWQISTG